jgi:hypothetical protein
MINHEKQQRLQGAIGAVRPREAGDLLTADQFAQMTDTIRRDYLHDLTPDALFDQARIVGAARHESTWAVIAGWMEGLQ